MPSRGMMLLCDLGYIWLHPSEKALSRHGQLEGLVLRSRGRQRREVKDDRGKEEGRKQEKSRSLWDLTAEGNAKPHLEFTP